VIAAGSFAGFEQTCFFVRRVRYLCYCIPFNLLDTVLCHLPRLIVYLLLSHDLVRIITEALSSRLHRLIQSFGVMMAHLQRQLMNIDDFWLGRTPQLLHRIGVRLAMLTRRCLEDRTGHLGAELGEHVSEKHSFQQVRAFAGTRALAPRQR